jgi:hypothetical protein
MSDWDIAVGIDAATISQATAAVYRQVYPSLFTGSRHVARDGLEFDVSWDVTAAPTVSLTPPPEGRSIVEEHLAALDVPVDVSHEQLVDAYVAALEPTTFSFHAAAMTMTIAGDGEKATVPVQLTVYVQAESAAGTVTLRPLKATGTTPSPDDEWFLNNVILPEAMHIAQESLPGVQLPALQFAGVALTPPAILITPTHAIALAALAGRPVPTPPFPQAWPASPFFAMLSDDAKLRVAQAGTREIAGKSFGQRGSVNIGIGEAKYSASATIGGLSLSNAGSGAPTLRFNAPVTGNVNAGIEIGCTTFGVNYTLYAKPDPAGTIALELAGTAVSARTVSLDAFVLLITPDGGAPEWIISALTLPLLQIVVAAFSPLISTLLNGISFPVMTLPSIPIDVSGVHLVVTPAGARFQAFGGRTTIEGTATIVGA